MATGVMNRTDLLISSVLGVCRLRDVWVASGAQKISNAFAEAMDDLVNVWDEGEIPADCRPIYDLYPPLKLEWTRFGEYASENRPSPLPSFWNALKTIESVLIAREDNWEPPVLETVTELRSLTPEVTWRQICYIYSYKGVGPFMNDRKEPVPSKAQQQWKWEQQVASGKNPDGSWLKPVQGAVDHLAKFPRDEHGNLISLASVARMNAGSRVEKRLQERAKELLGVSGSGGSGLDTDVEEPYVPQTRAELDRQEAGGGLSESVPSESGTFNNVPVSDDPLAQQLAASEEAALSQQIFAIKDRSPNISNRDIADSLNITVPEVKKALANREKANS